MPFASATAPSNNKFLNAKYVEMSPIIPFPTDGPNASENPPKIQIKVVTAKDIIH